MFCFNLNEVIFNRFIFVDKQMAFTFKETYIKIRFVYLMNKKLHIPHLTRNSTMKQFYIDTSQKT